jgi:hypothetical protein
MSGGHHKGFLNASLRAIGFGVNAHTICASRSSTTNEKSEGGAEDDSERRLDLSSPLAEDDMVLEEDAIRVDNRQMEIALDATKHEE